MQPEEISVAADRRSLRVIWPDGIRQDLKAATLRRMSRSAKSESARIAGREEEIDPGLTITGVAAVGVYAINITFSDGYAKGIYPWSLLRSAIGAIALPGVAGAGAAGAIPVRRGFAIS